MSRGGVAILWLAGAIACAGCSSGSYPDLFAGGYDIRIPSSSFQPVDGTRVVPWPDHLIYYSQGAAEAVFTTAVAGVYQLHVACTGTVGGQELPKFTVAVDGLRAGPETQLRALQPTKYAFEVELRPGEHRLSVAFTNDFFIEDERGNYLEDRNFDLIGAGLRKEPHDIWIPGENFRAVGGTAVAPWPDRLIYYSEGAAEAGFAVEQPGVYRVQVACAGTAGGDALPRFKVLLDGRLVGAETALTTLDPARYAFEVELRPGGHRLGVAFTNDFCLRNGRGDLLEDRNLALIGVRLNKVP